MHILHYIFLFTATHISVSSLDSLFGQQNKPICANCKFFIPNKNKCIEVKSTWTFQKETKCIFLKQMAAKKLGYDYEIWVYNKKGNIVSKYI